MRWVVYALIVINVAYFVSQALFGAAQVSEQTLTVEAEIEANSLVQQVVQSAPISQPAPVSDECLFVASSTTPVGELRSWLLERGIEGEYIELESVVGFDFLVVMPPRDSYDAAIEMKEALAEDGFDSFMMIDEYENGLSLGYFSQKKNAVNYIARLQNNGFNEAELLEKEKRAVTAWLKLSGVNASRYRQVAATAQQEVGQINLQRNSCESVAF